MQHHSSVEKAVVPQIAELTSIAVADAFFVEIAFEFGSLVCSTVG